MAGPYQQGKSHDLIRLPISRKIFGFDKMDCFSETLLKETYRLAHSKGPHSKHLGYVLPYRKTLFGRRLEEPCASFPDFAIIISFMLFMCFLSFMYFISKNFWFKIHVDSWFWRIIDRICWAFAIFRWIPNLQACTDRRTDGRTDSRTDGRTDSQKN